MNKDTILGIVRHILTIGGGLLVQRGNIDPSQAETLIGAIIAVVGVTWSILSKRKGETPAEPPAA